MIDTNEILAEFFQKRPEPDADGVFHYLLQEKDGALVVDITPIKQWTPERLEDTLIIDCERNIVCLSWINNGTYRATLGGSFPVETILYQDNEDEDEPHRELVFVSSHLIARVDLSPTPPSFFIFPRDDFYQMSYDEQTYRTLSPKNPPLSEEPDNQNPTQDRTNP